MRSKNCLQRNLGLAEAWMYDNITLVPWIQNKKNAKIISDKRKLFEEEMESRDKNLSETSMFQY